MGNRLTDDQAEPRSYGDIFDEMLPHYMVMGMTPEEYWDGESELKVAYRKAYRIRNENERRMADWGYWLQGLYIRDALQAVPLLVAGLNTKGVDIPQYPEQPKLETAEKEKQKEVRKKSEEDQMKLAMAMFQARIAQFNKNFEQRQQEKAKAVITGQ